MLIVCDDLACASKHLQRLAPTDFRVLSPHIVQMTLGREVVCVVKINGNDSADSLRDILAYLQSQNIHAAYHLFTHGPVPSIVHAAPYPFSPLNLTRV